MNTITVEFKKAAEERYEQERVRYVKSTQFASSDYLERLKGIAKDKILEEWQKAGKSDLADIDRDIELDVSMQLY